CASSSTCATHRQLRRALWAPASRRPAGDDITSGGAACTVKGAEVLWVLLPKLCRSEVLFWPRGSRTGGFGALGVGWMAPWGPDEPMASCPLRLGPESIFSGRPSGERKGGSHGPE
ncbi:Rna/Rnp Complex-1-Interacting Phosphatase, partial [Manis pentadactyla]